MEEEKATLLIVEDDLDVAEMLTSYFRIQGYEVISVNWGEDGVRAAQTSNPDLIILDIRLPDIDGFEVAQQLTENRKTQKIPIIFLTERRERMDKLRGLELKADDYITKPFDIQELRLRVRNALRRARQGSLNNTVTGMPEGGMVHEALQHWLDGAGESIFLVSIKNLSNFREAYGFVASDDLLRAVALMLRDLLLESGDPRGFLGHLAQNDFVMIARVDPRTAFMERIQKRLNQSFDYFYRDQDRTRGVFQEHGLNARVIEFTLPPTTQGRTLENLMKLLEEQIR